MEDQAIGIRGPSGTLCCPTLSVRGESKNLPAVETVIPLCKNISWVIPLLLIGVILPAFAQTGDVKGTIYQRSTRKPIAGADIHLTETDQHYTTDENGIFRILDLPEGVYTLVITHLLEPEPTQISVQISSGDTTEATIYLGTVLQLETVIVKGKRLPPTISRTDIRGSDLLRIPGGANDALKGLTTLPSIGIPNDYFGVLYIRGSEPGANLYYLDRTPLGYPFHWGGLLSTLSSETIHTIDIYAGGYGAEFGLDSQAVLDIHTRNSLDEPLNGKFNLNILYSEGLLEGRIGDNGYVSASGRRSYIDLIAGPIIENQTGIEQQFPYFSDYQIKGTYTLTEKHHLTVNAFAAGDHFKIVTESEADERTEQPPDSVFFVNGFNGQGIHLRSQLTEHLGSTLSLTHSHNFLNIDLDVIVTEETPEIPEIPMAEALATANFTYNIAISAPVYTLREDVTYRFAPAFQLESGVLFAFNPATSAENSDLKDIVSNESSSEAFTGFEKIHDEFGHDFYRTEGYLQGQYDPLAFLSVALGIRLDYLNVIGQLSMQPRGSVRFKLPGGENLRFAYGHYEQSPRPYQLLSENGNPTLTSSLTRHYIMELERPLSSQTELKFAIYYKNTRGVVTWDTVEEHYLNQGKAYVGGAEMFLRHRIRDKFFGWISYAYTHAEQREHPAAAYQPYLFDDTHIVSIVANYNIAQNFEIGGKWQYLSGTSEAPISSIVLVQDPVTRGLNPLLADADEQFKTELAPYHKLDFRVSYTRLWNIGGLKVGGFLDILNIYNRRNTIKFISEDAILDVQGQEVVIDREVFEAPQLPRIIYFGLTLEF